MIRGAFNLLLPFWVLQPLAQMLQVATFIFKMSVKANAPILVNLHTPYSKSVIMTLSQSGMPESKMPPNKDPFGVIRQSGDELSPFETGDMLLVLRQSGAVQCMNLGYDRSRLRLPAEQLTESDRRIQTNGRKLVALALVASNDKLMEILIELSNHPDLIDYDALTRAVRLH